VRESSARADGRLSGDRLRGFYAVIDRPDRALAERLVGGAGARALQVRMKGASTAELLAAARMAREVTRRHGALLVVNDRLDVALAAGADAVHLGQDDLPLAAAREVAAGRLWIGISTHDPAQVREAALGGADYLGFGPIYPTGTKENPDPVQGVAGLARAVVAAGGVPVVAIGGITPDRAPAVAAAGVIAACAIAAVNQAADPVAAGRRIARAWSAPGPAVR
jgi:thiamine-phosphate pyrophosphorylase